MGDFTGTVITDAGYALQLAVQAGQAMFEFTRAAAGDGALAAGKTAEGMTKLTHEMWPAKVGIEPIVGSETATIQTWLSNKGLQNGFWVREVGLFAKGVDGKEILFAVTLAGERPDWLACEEDAVLLEIQHDFMVVVGRDAQIIVQETDLNRVVLREELGAYAKTGDLAGYAKQSDLNNYAVKVHTHAQSEVTNLGTALDGKADKSHTHAAAAITVTPPTGMTAANAQAAINELFQFASDGKAAIAGTLGGTATSGDTFAQLAQAVHTANNAIAAYLEENGQEDVTQTQLTPLVERLGDINGMGLMPPMTAGDLNRIQIIGPFSQAAADGLIKNTGTMEELSSSVFYACASGTMRIIYTLFGSKDSEVVAYGQIHVNHSPVGALNSDSKAGGSGSFTEDITVKAGDRISLYARKSSSSTKITDAQYYGINAVFDAWGYVRK